LLRGVKMSSPRASVSGREQCFQQIEKLTNSHIFHSAESICRLLRYLAEHSLEHPGVALKEYQIGTEVLGRTTRFDPQSDATVRVQAGRLRMKLAEYYAHEGIDDPIVVELPKGSYTLTFHARALEHPLEVISTLPVAEQATSGRKINPWMIASLALARIILEFERQQKPPLLQTC
jgi:hypothetical protein